MKFRSVLILLIFLGVVSSCSMFPREKVWLYFPQNMSKVGKEINIEGRAYDKDGVESLVLTIENKESGETREYKLIRLASIYKGEVKEQLSKFRKKITFNKYGFYTLTVTMADVLGNKLSSVPFELECADVVYGKAFTPFTKDHYIPLLVLLIMNIAMVIFCRRYETLSSIVPYIITAVLWGNEVLYHIWHFMLGSWSITSNLLLHMCGMAVVFIPFMLFHSRENIRKRLFYLLYFWGFGGAVQALLTPDIGVLGYPSYRYFAFFISHGFIITSIVYMIWVKRYRVNFRKMLIVYCITIAFVGIVYGVDQLIRFFPPYEPGGYFFLVYPPVDGSIIDLLVNIFGPSPGYIFGLILLSFIVFALLVLPFTLSTIGKSIFSSIMNKKNRAKRV